MRSVLGSKKSPANVAHPAKVALDRTVSRTANPHDMFAYVQSLGIDPVREPEMIWIAEEAYQAHLPPGWSEHMDDTGCPYFYNMVLGESSWQHPMDDLYREIVEYQRMVQKAGGFWLVDDDLAEEEERTRTRLAEWTELYDEQNERFYFNPNTQESRLEDPRAISYHSLYTRINMVKRMRDRLPHLASVPRPIDPAEAERLRLLQEEEAHVLRMCIRLQSRFRVVLARKRAEKIRARCVQGDVTSPLRGRLMLNVKPAARDVLLQTTELGRSEKAAIKIQKLVRGVLARVRIQRRWRQKRYLDKVALRIQRQARRFIERLRRERAERARMLRAAMDVQAGWRGAVSRKRCRQLRKRRANAISIQCAIRQHLARKRVREARYSRRSTYSLVVQSSARSFAAQLHVRRLALLEEPVQLGLRLTSDRKEAGLTPWTWELSMASAEDERPMASLHPVVDLFAKGRQPLQEKAAVVIQRRAKGIQQRATFAKQLAEKRQRDYEESMKKENRERRGATGLQKLFRGFRVRKQDLINTRKRAFYEGRLARIEELQLEFERFAAQKDLFEAMDAEVKFLAARRIQCLARGYLARRLVERLEEDRLLPLKIWFEFKPTGPGLCQTQVRFVANPRFSDFYHWALTGRAEAEDSLSAVLARMQDEVSVCVDKYLEAQKPPEPEPSEEPDAAEEEAKAAEAAAAAEAERQQKEKKAAEFRELFGEDPPEEPEAADGSAEGGAGGADAALSGTVLRSKSKLAEEAAPQDATLKPPASDGRASSKQRSEASGAQGKSGSAASGGAASRAASKSKSRPLSRQTAEAGASAAPSVAPSAGVSAGPASRLPSKAQLEGADLTAHTAGAAPASRLPSKAQLEGADLAFHAADAAPASRLTSKARLEGADLTAYPGAEGHAAPARGGLAGLTRTRGLKPGGAFSVPGSGAPAMVLDGVADEGSYCSDDPADDAFPEETSVSAPPKAEPLSPPPNRRHYGGKMVNGRFVRTTKSSLKQMSEDEKRAILEDLHADRQRKVEELARRQQEQMAKKMRQKMEEVKKLRGKLGSTGSEPRQIHVHHHIHLQKSQLPPLQGSLGRFGPPDAAPPDMRRTASEASFRAMNSPSGPGLPQSASTGRLTPGATAEAPWTGALPALQAC